MFPTAHGVVSQGKAGAPPDPEPGGAFRFYRLYITDGNSVSFLGVSELQLFETEGGPNIALGRPNADATASGYTSTWYPSRAFDGSLGSGWQYSHSGNYPQWLQLDLGEGNATELAQYAIGAGHGSASRTPQEWVLQGSNNAVDWTAVDSRTGQTGWANQELRFFTIGT